MLETYLDIKELCFSKLKELKLDSEQYLEQLNEELIELEAQELVQDYIEAYEKYSKSPMSYNKNGVLISYLLGITKIDPIKNKVPKNYFMGKCPDIDIDIVEDLSEYVEDRLKNKYGNEYVAHICTHPTYTSKNLVKDLIRVMVKPDNRNYAAFKKMEALGDVIDSLPEGDFEKELQKKIEEKDTPIEAKELMEDDEIREIIVSMLPKLDGQVRSVGQHPAGVIIAPFPIYKQLPTQRVGGKSGSIITGLDGDQISDAGYLKIDILKTDCTKIISETVKLIKERRGIDLTKDIYKIDLEDKKCLREFDEARTLEIFQFNSNVCRNALKALNIKKFLDLSVVNAVVRPGASAAIDELKENMRINPNQIRYLHPSFREIFGETYGSMIYQEQVIEVFHKIAGYDLGTAGSIEELMRKKISKMVAKGKTRDEIKLTTEGKKYLAYEKKLRAATSKLGISDEELDAFIYKMQMFMAYSFNKAHSVGYAFAAYIEMWLKVYYPHEFYCALLNSTVHSGAQDKIARLVSYISAAKDYISLSGLDINNLHSEFSLSGDTLYTGCSIAKGISQAEIDALSEHQYTSTADFFLKLIFCRVKKGKGFGRVSKKTLLPLISLGAFDSLDDSRQSVYEKYIRFQKFFSMHGDDIIEFAKTKKGAAYNEIINEYQKGLINEKVYKKCYEVIDVEDIYQEHKSDSKTFLKNITNYLIDQMDKINDGSLTPVNDDPTKIQLQKFGGSVTKAKYKHLTDFLEGLDTKPDTFSELVEMYNNEIKKDAMTSIMFFQDIFKPRDIIIKKYKELEEYEALPSRGEAEKLYYGFYLMTNPLEGYEKMNEEKHHAFFTPLDLYSEQDAEEVRATLGIVSTIENRKVKNGTNAGKPYQVVSITNLKSSLSFTIWPDEKIEDLEEGQIIRVWLRHNKFGYSLRKERPDKKAPALVIQKAHEKQEQD